MKRWGLLFPFLQDLSREWRKPLAALKSMGVPEAYPALQLLLRVDAAATGTCGSENARLGCDCTGLCVGMCVC